MQQPAPQPDHSGSAQPAPPPPGGLVLPPGWGVVSATTADGAMAGGAVAGPPPVEAVCEECGESSLWEAAANGSIQKCPDCTAWMDVGGEDWFAEAEAAGPADEELLRLLPTQKGCGCGPSSCGPGGCG